MSIDLSEIREYTGADDDFTFMLFDKFLGHLETDLAELKKETDDENWLVVKGKVHSMLSSARIFFLNDIIALSKEIEVNCQSAEVEQVPGQVAKLISMYREIENEIRGLREPH